MALSFSPRPLRTGGLFTAALLTLAPTGAQAKTVIDGAMLQGQPVTVKISTGTSFSEDGTLNPFLNRRLSVRFQGPSGQVFQVPGYFAADGNAAESGASGGESWRAHLVPDEHGIWTWRVTFRAGTDVAVDDAPLAGSDAIGDIDGAVSGRFRVGKTDPDAPGFLGKGSTLRYVGERYLQWPETGEYFLKGGADSPENFLAYDEFDQTTGTHSYAPHAGDWSPGDPTWKAGKGKNIIGALNYLSSTGMNSVYFLTMNVGGDGDDVWPWTDPGEPLHFNCSKLDQWNIVFDHMDRLGLQLHVVTQETENDTLLDGGELGVERRLYYRELIARFGHHNAVVWNLGEEFSPSLPIAQQQALAQEYYEYFAGHDPHGHPVVLHTFPSQQDTFYNYLSATNTLEGPSLQTSTYAAHDDTIEWIDVSADDGKPWVVTADEIGPANDGVLPDAEDFWHDQVRQDVLWGNLMAGGAGCEWYFGYSHPDNDLNCEDWRSRDHMWQLTDIALDFFQTYLPFADMDHADELTAASDDYCLAKDGKVYAVYLPQGGTTQLTLPDSKTYTVRWFDPRNGGALQTGSVLTITGPGPAGLGTPPSSSTEDWVVLVRRTKLHRWMIIDATGP
jgi:hypothetical protein